MIILQNEKTTELVAGGLFGIFLSAYFFNVKTTSKFLQCYRRYYYCWQQYKEPLRQGSSMD